MEFTRGEKYETPYGKALVIAKAGRCATFVIFEVSGGAARAGWQKGMRFKAHPDDAVSPPPDSWKRLP